MSCCFVLLTPQIGRKRSSAGTTAPNATKLKEVVEGVDRCLYTKKSTEIISEGVEAQTRRGGAKPIEIGGPEPSYLYTCTLQRRELKRTMSES